MSDDRLTRLYNGPAPVMRKVLAQILESMLLADNPDRMHCQAHDYTKRLLTEGTAEFTDYMNAWFEYTAAERRYRTGQNDRTLANLIGTHSRWHKLVADTNDKYGERT
jgi:hypothetical protein